MKYILLLVSIAFTMSVSAQDVVFKFEPEWKATALSSAHLNKGDVIKLRSSNIKKNETLILQRCGEPCNTAKHISQWTLEDFKMSEKHVIRLKESGQYYFWIKKITKNGEVGPVFGDHDNVDGDSVILHFVSGTIVSVHIGK